MKVYSKIIVGDAVSEINAIQKLSLALSHAASWGTTNIKQPVRSITIPPLLLGAAHSVSLAIINGTQTPLEVVALSVRNTFELYLRLKHLLMSDVNCQHWREEAVTDQVQIYEGILSVNGPENVKEVILAEMDRVKQHAKDRGLGSNATISNCKRLAEATGLLEEYKAFYKMYSKLVHPSSFLINWPEAAKTPVFRNNMVFNIQLYTYLIFENLEEEIEMPSSSILDEAFHQYEEMLTRLKTI